jgi:inhibitor of cysteine peptidase
VRSSLVLICSLIFILFGVSACTITSGNVEVGASCDDFMKLSQSPVVLNKQVEVKAGTMFTVKLCSNQTTGFKWAEKANISDSSVLQQIDHKYVAPGTNMPGAPGEEIWTFKAVKAGTCTISMEYGRPWEGGEKGVWKYNLSAAVK